MNNDKNNKRDLILKKDSGYKPYLIAGIVLITIISAAGYFFYMNSNKSKGNELKSVHETAAIIPDAAGEIRYTVSEFDDGKARFYNYKHSGSTISYFILKSNDGKIRAAFDACDVCWEAGKGYTQQGDYMVCNNCGRRFISTMINVVSGGCNPSPLAVKIRGNEIVLKTSDIITGDKYFRGVKR